MNVKKIQARAACALTLVSLMLAARSAWAQGYESFSMIPDVGQGESTNATHLAWIDVTGWRYEMAGGNGYGDLHLSKRQDSTSPNLCFYVASARPVDHGGFRLECVRRGTSTVLYRVELRNVTPVNIRTWTVNPEADPKPMEEVQFRFLGATWTYYQYDPVTGELLRTIVKVWPES